MTSLLGLVTLFAILTRFIGAQPLPSVLSRRYQSALETHRGIPSHFDVVPQVRLFAIDRSKEIGLRFEIKNSPMWLLNRTGVPSLLNFWKLTSEKSRMDMWAHQHPPLAFTNDGDVAIPVFLWDRLSFIRDKSFRTCWNRLKEYLPCIRRPHQKAESAGLNIAHNLEELPKVLRKRGDATNDTSSSQPSSIATTNSTTNVPNITSDLSFDTTVKATQPRLPKDEVHASPASGTP